MTGTGAIVGKEDDVLKADPQPVPTACEKKKRAKKQRLVSYSSQDSGSDTGSRKNSRKRTAVTKMDGVMIDHIS